MNMKKILSEQSPTICMWAGLTTMAYSAVEAARATPEAQKRITRKKEEKQKDKLTVLETAQATWQCYALAAAACLTGGMLIVGANSMHIRRNAALMTGVTMTQEALREYREETRRIVGEKKDAEIERSVTERKMAANPVQDDTIVRTSAGTSLCYDRYCDRYFYSSAERIRQAGLEIARMLVSQKDASLDDFYDLIGLPATPLSGGRGWSCIEHSRGDVEVYIDSHLAPNDIPCTSFYFNYMPERNYETW